MNEKPYLFEQPESDENEDETYDVVSQGINIGAFLWASYELYGNYYRNFSIKKSSLGLLDSIRNSASSQTISFFKESIETILKVYAIKITAKLLLQLARAKIV